MDYFRHLWYNKGMENKAFTREELNNVPKDFLVSMYMQLLNSFNETNETLRTFQEQNTLLIKKIEALQENIAVLTQQRFGRKTEKNCVSPDQLTLDLGDVSALNEAEELTENGIPEEPDAEEIIVVKRRTKGKRKNDLASLERLPDVHHELTEEKLNELFPNGYTRFNDEVYSEVEYIPAKYCARDHYVAVYSGNKGEGIVRADKPERLLHSSILTPSLAASVINAKYVNAVPLNRQAAELKRNGINISKQNMAGWMIRISEMYLDPVIDAMWAELRKSHLIHCDETPFKVTEDSGDKSYMWVYHAADDQGARKVFIYDYDPKRNTDVLRSRLDGYSGILMTDGYTVYHTYERENKGRIKVAGCWAHAKRKFAEIVKSLKPEEANALIALEAVRRIQSIYHVDKMFKDVSPEERLKHRQTSVLPLVDAYFAWVKDPMLTLGMDKSGKSYKAIQYSINQEQFLRVFLEDPMVPLDNNDAERSIRAFCVGKHNWHISDTKAGAKASGRLYSLAETAKANGLRPYEYFKYLLEQMLLHIGDSTDAYIDDLVPWSDKIPDYCRKFHT